MQINQAALAAITKGYRVIYLEAFHGAKPMWPLFAVRTTSTGAQEIYHWLGAVPGMRELVDEVQIANLSAHNFAIPNKEYERTIGIKRADIERDTWGVYNPMIQAMGAAAAQHPDELLAQLMVDGFTKVDYTGSPFFAADKEAKAGGVKFTNKGTKKLSQANFRTGRQNIKSRRNAEGRSMNLGVSLTLLVSPKYEDTAREILLADRNANGATNTDKGTATLEVWPQLSAVNEDAWFLFETGYAMKPFIVQFEKDPAFNSVTDLSDSHVMLRQEFLYQVYGRYNAGYALPELAYGSDGSQAA